MSRNTIAKFLLAAAVSPVTAHATSNFWKGTTSGNYNDSSRWLFPQVPDANDELTIEGAYNDDFPVAFLNSNGAFLTLDVGTYAVVQTGAFQLGVGETITLNYRGELDVETGGRVKTAELFVGEYDYDYDYTSAGYLKMLGGIVDATDRISNLENSQILGHGQINITGASSYFSSSGLIKPDASLSFFATSGAQFDLAGAIDVTTPGANLTFSGPMLTDVTSDIRLGRTGRLNFGTWTLGTNGTLTLGGAGADVPRLTASGSTFAGQVIVGVATFGGVSEIAGSATFQPTSSLLVTSGDTLKMLGTTTYRGGSVTGNGTLSQNGSAIINTPSTIGVNTYDWDGSNENSTTTIQPNSVLTITSDKVESNAGSDGYDGTVILQGGNLDVQTPSGWRLDGTMRFDGPSLSRVEGTTMTVVGQIIANTGRGRINATADLLSTSTVTANAGETVEFSGNTNYRGGVVTGLGTVGQYGDSHVLNHTTVNPALFDWDGFNGHPEMTIHSGVTFTINSPTIEAGDATADGYDGTVTLNDGNLAVNTSNPWRLDGTMNLNDQPAGAVAMVQGSPMRLFGTVNTVGNPLVASPVEFNGGTVNTAGGNVLFANPTSSTTATTFHKAGAGTMTIASNQSYAPATVAHVHAGTLALNTDAGAGGANLSIDITGRARINATQHLNAVTIQDGGLVLMTAGPKLLAVKSLAIAGGPGAWQGELDLVDSGMLIDYTGASPLAAVTSQLRSGYAAGAWGGKGIRSSFAAVTPGRGIGIAEAAELGITTFMGEPVDATTLLLQPTIQGDANLDRAVNISDFALLAANFNTPAGWTHGDFNYSGVTDIADFALLAGNFNQSLPMDLSRGAAVPEPTAAALIAATGLLGRRRRGGQAVSSESQSSR